MAELDVIYHVTATKTGAKMTMYEKTDVVLLNESASWLVSDEDINIATCSNCHRRVHICNAVIFNFCPFCGMRIGNKEGESDGNGK